MSYRSLAAHNAECNWLFYKFQDCEREYPCRRFLGYCGDIHKEMIKCIKDLLEANRKKNFENRHRLPQKENITKEEHNN